MSGHQLSSLQELQEALRAALDAVDSFRKLGDRRMEVELNGSRPVELFSVKTGGFIKQIVGLFFQNLLGN